MITPEERQLLLAGGQVQLRSRDPLEFARALATEQDDLRIALLCGQRPTGDLDRVRAYNVHALMEDGEHGAAHVGLQQALRRPPTLSSVRCPSTAKIARYCNGSGSD